MSGKLLHSSLYFQVEVTDLSTVFNT